MGEADVPDDRRSVTVRRARTQWHQLGLSLRSVTPQALARFVMAIAACVVIGWLFVTGSDALFWFFIGAILAYLLLPVIDWAERWMPRWAAIILSYAVVIVAIALLVIYVVPPLINELGDALRSVPDAKTVQNSVTHLDAYIATLPPDLQKFINDTITAGADTIKHNLLDLAHNIAAFILGIVTNLLNLVGFLFGFLVVPFWVFYVLRDQRKGKTSLDGMLPTSLRLDFWAIVRIADDVMGRWLRGQILLSTVLAVEVFFGLNLLTLLGVPGIRYVLLLAAIAFVTSPIPYIANYLAAIPALFMGLQTSIQTALAIGVIYIISQNVQDNLLGPKINGKALSIHPAILMPTILLLSRFGLFWVVLAGPLAATGRDMYRYVYGRLQEPPRPPGVLPRDADPSTVTTPDPDGAGT